MKIISEIRSMMRAILAAMASLVMIPVYVGGRIVGFVMRWLEPPVPPGADAVEEAVTQQAPSPQPDDRLAAMQRALEAVSIGEAPARRDLMRLSTWQRAWLAALTQDEADLALLADDQALKAHLQGGRQLNGVLACRQDAMSARVRERDSVMKVVSDDYGHAPRAHV